MSSQGDPYQLSIWLCHRNHRFAVFGPVFFYAPRRELWQRNRSDSSLTHPKYPKYKDPPYLVMCPCGSSTKREVGLKKVERQAVVATMALGGWEAGAAMTSPHLLLATLWRHRGYPFKDIDPRCPEVLTYHVWPSCVRWH